MVSRVNAFPAIEKNLSPSTQDDEELKVLLLGMCQIGPLIMCPVSGIKAEHYLWESLQHGALPSVQIENYDVVLVGLTLRHFMIEAGFEVDPSQPWGNDILWPRLIADNSIDVLFNNCVGLLRRRLDALLTISHGKLTFVMSFLEPKHNYFGNIMPRYSLTNPRFFVEQLNRELSSAIEQYSNVHFFDINELASLIGTARLGDDYTMQSTHASFIIDHMIDEARIQTSTPPTHMWSSQEVFDSFGELMWQRLRDNIFIIRKPLQIKAIIVDLDDTMWRGIAVEEDKHFNDFAEGWPLGLAEALLIYRARGGILAICSKNDFSTINDRFNYIFQGRVRLSDFASIRINFKRKSQNIAEILEEINLMPDNVLFIDDNPREIDEVRQRFPEMQFLSADHYDWRRQLLLSPLTQVAAINRDTALRTASIQAQIANRVAQQSVTREEWLDSLKIVETLEIIRNPDAVSFSRMFELINKTNQFNTTGKRWSHEDIVCFFESGGIAVGASVRDRITDHGMVGVALLDNASIEQVVLSCRVFGNGIELALGKYITALGLVKSSNVSGTIIDTGRNKTCHDFFSRLGFIEQVNGKFVTDCEPESPSYIETQLA